MVLRATADGCTGSARQRRGEEGAGVEDGHRGNGKEVRSKNVVHIQCFFFPYRSGTGTLDENNGSTMSTLNVTPEFMV